MISRERDKKNKEERKDWEGNWRIWSKVENDEGKARGKQKKWKLRRKIKMRGGNVAGGHESEGCKEREGVGRRWDTVRAGGEAELERRGVPCQAPPAFAGWTPCVQPVTLSHFPAFPLSVSLELYGVGMVHASILSPSRRVSHGKFWGRKFLAREEELLYKFNYLDSSVLKFHHRSGVSLWFSRVPAF